jgi:predicted nucleic acid-binding protein
VATTYIETSALVKRYVAEVGSAWVRRMVARPVQHVIYTAALTEVEVRSALQRLVCLIFLYSARSIAHWGSEREKTQPLEQFSVAY